MILLQGIAKVRHKFVVKFNVLILIAGLLFNSLIGSAQGTIKVEPPKIKYICINAVTGNVEIAWEKSATPEVNYYTIKYYQPTADPTKYSWKEVPGIIIPSSAKPFVSFDTTLLESVDINNKPLAFAVEATIDDANQSQVDGLQWDSTILLRGSYDTCLAEIPLSWNSYDFNQWDYDAFVYRIYVSEAGGPFVVNTTVTKFVNEFTLTNLEPNKNYSIYIAAIPEILELRSDSATSNRIDINTFRALQPDSIIADYATISGNNVEMQFTIDPKSELEDYRLLRAKEPTGPFDTIKLLKPENNILRYTDPVDFNSGPYYYSLQAINYCNLVVEESMNLSSTILLRNTGEPLSPVLEWNAYEEWYSGAGSYTLERRFGEEDFQIIASQVSLSYADNEINVLATNNYPHSAHSVCYRLTAQEENNPLGNNYTSQSNTVCIELPLNIRFEYDAFIPGNPMNGTFGPQIDFVPDEFKFEIVDRAGRVVYESTDPANCDWDGRYNGQYVSAGAYMYVLWYRNGNDKKHFLRGGLAVVKPG